MHTQMGVEVKPLHLPQKAHFLTSRAISQTKMSGLSVFLCETHDGVQCLEGQGGGRYKERGLGIAESNLDA